MPRKGPLGPAAAHVKLAQHLAEGEHAVIAREVEPGHVGLGRDGPVMGVVEEENEPAALGAPAPERLDEPGLVPFVHEHHVGPVERAVEVEALAGIGLGHEGRKGSAEARQRRLALLGQEIRPAPRPLGLENADLVPPRLKLAQHAAQEMGVAVVPARHQRVDEEDEAHGR